MRHVRAQCRVGQPRPLGVGVVLGRGRGEVQCHEQRAERNQTVHRHADPPVGFVLVARVRMHRAQVRARLQPHPREHEGGEFEEQTSS